MLNIPDDRELDRFIFMHLSGNRQRNIRQQIIFELTGKKEPIAKCGVNKIAELLKAERAVEGKRYLISCDEDKNDTIYLQEITERKLKFTPDITKAKVIDNRKDAKSLLAVFITSLGASRNPQIIEKAETPSKIIVCSLPKYDFVEPEKQKAEPKKQLKDTRGNLFHDHQDQIPARKNGNQLSMF